MTRRFRGRHINTISRLLFKGNQEKDDCYDMLDFHELEDIVTVHKDLNEPHLIYNEEDGTYEESDYTIGEWIKLNKDKEYIPIALDKQVIGYVPRALIIRDYKPKKEDE